eukprot:458488-Rhodomonas_salina.3
MFDCVWVAVSEVDCIVVILSLIRKCEGPERDSAMPAVVNAGTIIAPVSTWVLLPVLGSFSTCILGSYA